MTRLTICRTANGWLVVDGWISQTTNAVDVIPGSRSFDSLDRAISEIRKTIRGWHNQSSAEQLMRQLSQPNQTKEK